MAIATTTLPSLGGSRASARVARTSRGYAATTTTARAKAENVDVVSPPESREEAIRQARRALSIGLGRRDAGRGKVSDKSVLKRISRGSKRLVVDFPLQSESADTVAGLASELLDEVATEKTALCFGSAAACERAKTQFNLANCFHADESIPRKLKASSLVMVAVTEAQASSLLGNSRWNSVILINPKGGMGAKVSSSFDTVYEFLPLLVQGFMGSKAEGAILKCLSDSPESDKWNIFLKDGKTFKRIASQATRPDNDELELALYNNVASSNPLIKGFKSVKETLFSKKD